MASRTITLQFPGRCADCGAALPAGTRARYYGRGKIYGLECHKNAPRTEPSAYERGDHSPGARASHYDRHGVYAVDGTKLGSSCGCIDYPCCGH